MLLTVVLPRSFSFVSYIFSFFCPGRCFSPLFAFGCFCFCFQFWLGIFFFSSRFPVALPVACCLLTKWRLPVSVVWVCRCMYHNEGTLESSCSRDDWLVFFLVSSYLHAAVTGHGNCEMCVCVCVPSDVHALQEAKRLRAVQPQQSIADLVTPVLQRSTYRKRKERMGLRQRLHVTTPPVMERGGWRAAGLGG